MDGGYGPWGRGRNRQAGRYMEHGGQWQGYEYHEPLMDAGGLGFNEGYGMPSDLPPIPDRPSFHSEYEFSDGRNPGFDRNAGWQGEMGEPYWDRPGRPPQDFQRPFDYSIPRGMDDHFAKNKRKRIFAEVQPSPINFDQKRGAATKTWHQQSKPWRPSSASQVHHTKQQNGDAKKVEVKKSQVAKDTKTKEADAKAAPGKIEGQPVSSTPSTTFQCKLCKFETPDENEIQKHFVSSLHVDIIKHLYIFLPKMRVDFIQDYLIFEKKKVSRERKRQNLQPKKDSFKGIGQEHLFHRVEVAHCLACDALIPDVPELLIEHTKSESHEQKCKTTLKDIKSNCLAMAKEILQDKYALELLKMYNQGKNPFKETEHATVHIASSHEVLVAEEDDNDIEDVDGTQSKEGSSLNALPPSGKEKILMTLDDEEAAEAP